VELRHPRTEVLRVAPDRFVAEPDVVVLDPDPQIRIAEAHAIAGGRPVAARVLLPGQLSHRAPRGRRTAPARPRGSRPARTAPTPPRGHRGGTPVPPRGRTPHAGSPLS